MSVNIIDTSLQTTSSLTPANSLNKRLSDDTKRRKSPFSMQKELFLHRSELVAKYSQGPHSLSPKRRRVSEKPSSREFDLSFKPSSSAIQRKKVTFKGNFIQIINVISYKKYYIESEKEKNAKEHVSRCNCFIF